MCIHIAPQSEEDIDTVFNSLSSDTESEHITDLPCYAPAGTERHNAIKRFEELKKQYPGAEHIKEIEKARWEKKIIR